ncbi:MAG: hypothetical protein U0169_14500 [Polyangiaceae bacterium]
MRGKVVAIGLAIVLGIVVVVCWLAYGGRNATLAAICDAPQATEQADENREEACGQLCGAGSVSHCVPYGDVLLRRNPGSVAARESARDAYVKACLQGRTDACERHKALPSNAAPKPSSSTRN